MVKFGDYVQIEQKRYGAPSELYIYKVIGTVRSNTYREVPVKSGEKEKVHSEVQDCVRCICAGVVEDTIETFRIQDVKKVLINT